MANTINNGMGFVTPAPAPVNQVVAPPAPAPPAQHAILPNTLQGVELFPDTWRTPVRQGITGVQAQDGGHLPAKPIAHEIVPRQLFG